MIVRLGREVLRQMMRRRPVVVVRVAIRVVILHRHRQNVGQVAFRDLLLVALLDVVVELVERQLVTAMVRIQKLLAMLTRQIRCLGVASIIAIMKQAEFFYD